MTAGWQLALAGLIVEIVVGATVPGILVASKLAISLPDRALRLALGAVLLFSGIQLAPEVGAVTLAAGVFLAALAVLGGRLRARRHAPAAVALGTHESAPL